MNPSCSGFNSLKKVSPHPNNQLVVDVGETTDEEPRDSESQDEDTRPLPGTTEAHLIESLKQQLKQVTKERDNLMLRNQHIVNGI